MDLQGKISQANGRLKFGKVRVTIEQVGDRLYLRGTFPPKPNSQQTKPSRQRIATKLPATPKGIQLAETKARELSLYLMTGSFEWEKTHKIERVGDLIEKFGRSLLSKGLSETSWKKEYRSPLLKIADEPLDVERLQAILLEKTDPDTRTRRRWCLAFANLLDFASIPNDLRNHTGKYCLTAVSPRDLPTDNRIWQAWRSLLDVSPLWGNIFGLMAVYGLRNHEAFFCDLDDAPLLWVSRGKTNERYVYPLYPEWGELVSGDRPKITRKDNQGYGGAVTQAFSDHSVGFTPYNLRHAWAARAVECGLDPALAAAQMGHRLDVHNRVYQHWLKRSVHQRAFEMLRDNPNRPKPPS